MWQTESKALSVTIILFSSDPYVNFCFVRSNWKMSKLFRASRKPLPGESKRRPQMTIKNSIKTCQVGNFQKSLLSVRRIENVVDALDIFRTPGFEWIRRRLHSTVRSHFIHYVPWDLRRCMRCRFSSTIRCIIVSWLLWRNSENDKVDVSDWILQRGWIETSLLVISASAIVSLRLFFWSCMLRCWLAVSGAFAAKK